MKKSHILLLMIILLSACAPSPEQQATLVATALTATADTWTETPLPTSTYTPTDTATPTFPLVPTDTLTPSITPSPTISATPTFAFPTVTVNQQAHCRYGPSAAYLHAADLYPGDVGTVRGRFLYSKWLFVKFDKIDYFCWVAPSVVDVVGDISKIKMTELNLQSIGSNQYGPPNILSVVRDGNKVTVTWQQIEMTKDKDRGYFWELFVCQNGNYLWWTDSYPDQFTTSFTVKDEAGCSEPSSGLLYTVEKHGYSDPVKIPWPAP
jgi:hypothetical protein